MAPSWRRLGRAGVSTALCQRQRKRRAVGGGDFLARQVLDQPRLDRSRGGHLPQVVEFPGIGLQIIKLAPGHAMDEAEAVAGIAKGVDPGLRADARIPARPLPA